MQWTRLDKAQSDALIDRLVSAADASMFYKASSVVQCAKMPFYRNFMLYRITDYGSLPSFSLEFLGDGTTFYMLDGTPDPLLIVNSRGSLDLNHESVLPYVQFFFEKVTTGDGDIYLIDQLEELPFIESLSFEQMKLLKSRHEDISVNYNDQDDSYTISADLFYTGTLLKAGIEVNNEGQINIHDRGMLMSNAPFSEGGHSNGAQI